MTISQRALKRIQKSRRTFTPASNTGRKRKTWNSSWDDPNDIAHPLDDDILQAMRCNKVKHEDALFSLMDPDVDGEEGAYHVCWDSSALDRLYDGMLYRSLEVLRRTENPEQLHEELEWIASTHFDQVCSATGHEANRIRISLPSILEKSEKPLIGEAKKLINAFKQLGETISLDETSVEHAALFNK